MEELWFKFKFHLVKLAYFQRRSRLRRYAFALIVVAIIFPLFFFIPKAYFNLINSQTVSLLMFILIVTASSWYGGLGPGILTTIVTSIISHFTILSEDFPAHPETGDLLIASVYMVVGFSISLMSEARYEAEFQKDRFMALAAHEIKNPLAIIKGYVGLLQNSIKKKGKNRIFKYADEIDVQAERLLGLINDLLDISKIEIGKIVYKDEPLDFDSLIKKIVNNQRIASSKREIIVSGSANKVIKADGCRLGQVVTNLLVNAIKYSPEKSPIRVRLKSQRGKVVLAVKDYGIGIPRSEQKAIFKHFYRSKRIRQEKIGGLGLGLFISSQIIKHYHGKLYVKSNGGKGSTFYLEIPKNC